MQHLILTSQYVGFTPVNWNCTVELNVYNDGPKYCRTPRMLVLVCVHVFIQIISEYRREAVGLHDPSLTS